LSDAGVLGLYEQEINSNGGILTRSRSPTRSEQRLQLFARLGEGM